MIYLAVSDDNDEGYYYKFDSLDNAILYIKSYKVKYYTLSDLPFFSEEDETKLMDEKNYKHVTI